MNQQVYDRFRMELNGPKAVSSKAEFANLMSCKVELSSTAQATHSKTLRPTAEWTSMAVRIRGGFIIEFHRIYFVGGPFCYSVERETSRNIFIAV